MGEDKEKVNTLLTQEELESAAKQIAFDLGVDFEKALEFAEEAQKELYYDRGDLCTRETVNCVADAKHLPDKDVPAKLEVRDQGTKAFPGENIVNAVREFARNSYNKAEQTVKN